MSEKGEKQAEKDWKHGGEWAEKREEKVQKDREGWAKKGKKQAKKDWEDGREWTKRGKNGAAKD